MVVSGKGAYLKQLTSRMHMRSVDIGKELDGSTPPSVFIGSWNYPKVFAGPMLVQEHGDTSIVDSPEQWIPKSLTTQDIVDFRLSLVRGKQQVGITDLDNRLVEQLRNISLAARSVESQVEFRNKPMGQSFTDEHTPHGPSAFIQSFEIDNCKWDMPLEKVYYDTDFKAADAVTDLYRKDMPFSRIQKAFSIGAMGTEKRRRLVPTRWSITACDDILGKMLLEDVRHYQVIDNYRLYEYDSLNNYYAVILMPTVWQYEWIEAFLHVLGREEMVFSDYETNLGKKEYSSVGGCYYSCKFGVLEALARRREQAGALVLREAYKGYVPLGVFNVRENVRTAMRQEFKEFANLKDILAYLSNKMRLPMPRFVDESALLKELLLYKQTTLKNFY
ncbi:MAG: hypothetical protein JXB14_04635 [Candidatus Altiarchaeota archaeon]|nr:hypothetical protein [Candidatus Altiarchaeota archaeon]